MVRTARKDRPPTTRGCPPCPSLRPAAALDLAGADLVCFTVPARALPAALAEHGGRVPSRANVLVASKGLVPPLGTMPTAYVASFPLTAEVGITASALCPAYTRTAIVEAQLEERSEEDLLAPQAVKRLLEPAEVAAAAAWLLGPEGRAVTGAPLVMDLGWTAH